MMDINSVTVWHELKTDPLVYDDVAAGIKTHEIRFNDRGYEVGHGLILKKTTHTGEEIRNGSPLEFTGDECRKIVSHVLSGYGLQPGWVILSLYGTAEQERDLYKAALDQATKALNGEIILCDSLRSQLQETAQLLGEWQVAEHQKHLELESLRAKIKEAPHWVAIDCAEDAPCDDQLVLFDGCDISVDYVECEVDYGTSFFANGTEATHYLANLTLPPEATDEGGD